MMKSILVLILCLFITGCGTIDNMISLRDTVSGWFDKDGKPAPDPHPDCEGFSEIPGVSGIDTRGWSVTSHLVIKFGGDGILLDWNSTQWPSLDANVGSVWIAYRRNGAWSKAWRYDQIRSGQHTRDVPLATRGHPKPGHGDYNVVPADADAIIVWVSGMARDNKRTVEERTQGAFLALNEG